MRILQIGKFYAPFHGGMERVLGELCEGFAQRGHAVKAIVASHEGPYSDDRIDGVEVVRLGTCGQIFSQPLIVGLRAEIRAFRPDIVHFHLPNPLALITGFGGEAPVCLTIHAEAGGWRRRPDRALTEFYARRAQALIFSSPEMAESYRSDQTSGSRPLTRVIPFGFRFDYLRSVGAVQDPSLILFVGRMVPYKGLETLLEAMVRVRGKLALVGDGPQRPVLQAMVERLGIRDNVRFLGAVSDEHLVDWYERCAIYVQPSISNGEAFGISMLEAMRTGRPVVSTDLPTGVNFVNRHLHTGLVVPPRDPLVLAAALNTLLKDQDLARRLGSGARAHEAIFSADTMIETHLDLYRSLVGKSANGAIFPAESELGL